MRTMRAGVSRVYDVSNIRGGDDLLIGYRCDYCSEESLVAEWAVPSSDLLDELFDELLAGHVTCFLAGAKLAQRQVFETMQLAVTLMNTYLEAIQIRGPERLGSK